MGSFLFKWSHPASEVYVTGSFDDWAKTIKLDKNADGHFQKLVDLPSAEEKVVYKFVVDENWTTDHTAATQIDEHGNSNNILLPEYITKKSTGTVGGITADLPGAFPATPAPATEDKTFSVNPIPATAGVGNPVQLKPGEKVPDPSTLTKNTIASTATMDKESYEKSASGAPVLPNPITPQTDREKEGAGLFGLPPVSKNMIPESSLPMGVGAAAAAESDPGVTIQGGGGAPTTAALAGQVPLEPRGTATIISPVPDASIQSGGGAPTTAALAGQVPLEPKGTASTVDQAPDVAIQGGGGAATTAALAGQVPVEPRGVPSVVQDSQDQASSAARGASVEASANPEAVLEKASVNQEVEKAVPTAPATSGEQSVGAKVAEIAGGAAAGATAAVAAAAAYASKAKDNVTSDETKEAAKTQAASAQDTASSAAVQAKDSAASAATQAKDAAASAATQAQTSAVAAAASVKSMLPEPVQQKLDAVLPAGAQGTGNEPAAPQVPATVKESIAEAHQPAEGAVNPTQVSNKAEVEQELLENVKPSQSSGAPAPTATATTSATAPTTINKSTETPLAAAGVAGAAGAATTTIGKSTESPLNASATSPTTTTAANPKPQDSRDVSPMTRGEGQKAPVVTSGITTSTVPTSSGPAASPSTPVASNPAVSAAKQAAKSPTQVAPSSPVPSDGGSRSSNRRSFFGRMKDKIKHKRAESKGGES